MFPGHLYPGPLTQAWLSSFNNTWGQAHPGSLMGALCGPTLVLITTVALWGRCYYPHLVQQHTEAQQVEDFAQGHVASNRPGQELGGALVLRSLYSSPCSDLAWGLATLPPLVCPCVALFKPSLLHPTAHWSLLTQEPTATFPSVAATTDSVPRPPMCPCVPLNQA